MEGIGVTILAAHGRTDDPGLAVIVREDACEDLQEDVLPFQRGEAPEDPNPERSFPGQVRRCGGPNRVVDHRVGDDDIPTRDSQRYQRGIRVGDDDVRHGARPSCTIRAATMGR
jgi:hypothetical protein